MANIDNFSTPPQTPRTLDQVYQNNQRVRAEKRSDAREDKLARARERLVAGNGLSPWNPEPLTLDPVMAQVRPGNVEPPLHARVNVAITRLTAPGGAGTQMVTVLLDRPPHAPMTFRDVRALPTKYGWAVELSDSQWKALTEAASLP